MALNETRAADAAAQQSSHRPALALVDSHAHVFARGLPLAQQRRYAPDYDAPLDTYLAQLDAHGVARGVLVQPSFLGTDCTYLLAALRSAPQRLRGVAVIAPDCGFDELDGMARAGVTGIRLNLFGVPDAPLEHHIARPTLDALRELGWHVEVHVEAARLPHIVEPLLNAELNVVVDHFGRPDPALGVRDEGFRYLLDIVKTRRVWTKVSAIYRNERANEPARFARAAFDLLCGAAGADRLMWGSDWPHTQFETTERFGSALDAVRALLSDDAQSRAVLATTPAGFYRFDDA